MPYPGKSPNLRSGYLRSGLPLDRVLEKSYPVTYPSPGLSLLPRDLAREMQNHDLHTKLNVPSRGINAPVPTGRGICPVSVGACVMPPGAEMSLAEPVPSGVCRHVWKEEGAGTCSLLRLQLQMAPG